MAWKELRKEWHDTTVDYCDVCGNLLIHKYWEFQGDDREPLRSCRQDDERIYRVLIDFEPARRQARESAHVPEAAT